MNTSISSTTALRIDDVLKREFGFEAFLPGQKELVEAVMAGRDALGVLPTGGGKSLTYQLPATAIRGLTVVVSPLIALMKDQVDAFNRRGRSHAVAIHSTLSVAEVSASLAQIHQGSVALLYVAPERLELPGYRERIVELGPKLFVVDEAHCVNQWGYDFRPSYLSLKEIIARLRPVPVLALTATATPDMRREIVTRLGLIDPVVVVAPFDRPNLRFEVQTSGARMAGRTRSVRRGGEGCEGCGPGDKLHRVVRILADSTDGGRGDERRPADDGRWTGTSTIRGQGGRGDEHRPADDGRWTGTSTIRGQGGSPRPSDGAHIVYVGRRKDADGIAADLCGMGFKAVAYHAGMKAEERKTAQETWLSGEKPIAVATVAFGMGIDNPKVRTVIHYQHPASLEAYYQEAGRAGRDGAPARCVMLFSRKDVSLAHYFIRNRYPSRDQIVSMLNAISPSGTLSDELKAGASGMTDEQFNVALLTLLEQGLIRQDESDRLRREAGEVRAMPLNLDTMYARKAADYRRLKSVIDYAENRVCHRACLLGYFGEALPAGYRCGNCSACEGGRWDERRPADVGRWTGMSTIRGQGGRWARGHGLAAEAEARRVFTVHRRELESKGRLSASTFARFLGASASKRIPSSWRGLGGYGALADFPIKVLRTLAGRVLGRGLALPPGRAGVDAGELGARQVPREVGLSILGLVGAKDGLLPPSGVAGVLRGSRTCDAARQHADLMESPLFGIQRRRPYDDLVTDVLAMRAKGYLCFAPGKSKRLYLTPEGKAVLAKKRPR